MQCWQCNEEKELKHFVIDGVLHYENCNQCYFEDLFGDEEEPKKQSKAQTQPKREQKKPVELTRLQKIKKDFISFKQKSKINL